MEEWKVEKEERPLATSLGVYSEENLIHLCVVYSQGCGRCCSELVFQVSGKGLQLVWSGIVVGRQNGTLTVGPCEWVGGSLERRASPGWTGSQEG